MIIKSIKPLTNLSSQLDVFEVIVNVIINDSIYDLSYYAEIKSEESIYEKGFKDYTLHIIKDIYKYISEENKEYIKTIKVNRCETFYSMVGRDINGWL